MASRSDRRTFLKAAGAAGIVGFSGCTQLSGGGGGSGFPSEDVTFIVPYGEGSGFDTYVRGLAPIWENQFDGDVNIVVENVTGGGGRRGTEQLYNAEDGHTVGVINVPGFAISQVLLDVNYDLRELTHLGRIVRATYILQTGGNSNISQWQDLQNSQEVTWGITGVGSTSSFTSILTASAADINLRFVSGYDGGTDALRACQQGEVMAVLYTASTSRPFIEESNTRALLQYTSKPLSWLEDVSMTADTNVFSRYQDLNLSRIVSAPPDIENAATETLRTTLWNALQSSEFEKWAKGADRSLGNRAQAEKAASVVSSAFETAQANRDVLSRYIDQ